MTNETKINLEGRCIVDESVMALDECSLPHKFIIAKVGEQIVYYADLQYDAETRSERAHQKIARKNNLEDAQIIGGGHVWYSGESRYHPELAEERPMYPIFTSQSSRYGSIPNEFLALFKDQLVACPCYNSKNEKKMMFDMISPPSLDSFLKKTGGVV